MPTVASAAGDAKLEALLLQRALSDHSFRERLPAFAALGLETHSESLRRFLDITVPNRDL